MMRKFFLISLITLIVLLAVFSLGQPASAGGALYEDDETETPTSTPTETPTPTITPIVSYDRTITAGDIFTINAIVIGVIIVVAFLVAILGMQIFGKPRN